MNISTEFFLSYSINLTFQCLGSSIFLLSTSMFGCNAVYLLSCHDKVKQEIKNGVAKGIQNGVFKPLERHIIHGLKSTHEMLQYFR